MAMAPALARAGSGQAAVFEENGRLLQNGPDVRDATLDELRSLGVDVVKFQLAWADVAGRGRRKPAGFDGSDPSDYPGWGHFDGLVQAARARGFQVMAALSGPAPGWATHARSDSAGVDRPSPAEYGRFAEAAGERYPEIDIWTLWNEPNHFGFLFPQSSRRGVPFAPHFYRQMVASAVSGLGRAGQGGDTILFGELLPIAPRALRPRTNMKPVLWLREFFCLDRRGRAFRGRAARARGCNRFRRVGGVDGFAYHPYTRPNGPRGVEPSPDDATIRSIGRITRVLDLARRKGRIGGGRLNVWNTEFGYQSSPPDRFQTPLSRIPGFINEAEWISFRNRRVASYSQYTLVDDPLGGSDRYGRWQGGLRFVDFRAKPGVYEAYRLPLFVRLLGPGAVEVWGAARPGGAGAVAQLEQRSGRGAFANLGGPITVSNVRGYFRARFRIPRAAGRTYRFQSGGETSRSARAVVR